MITLYTIDCPKCKVLEKKLNNNNVPFITNKDIDQMISKGIQSTPVLEVNGNLLSFSDAIKWVDNYKESKE